MDRLTALRYMVGRLTDELVVASLGNEKIDLVAAGDRPRNFYMWNAMGLAGSVGLGLAMAHPDTRVIVLDGDGSLLMNLGSLATTMVRNPPNFIHIVWDNRMYQTTGEQPSATAFTTDLGKVAAGCGFESVARCDSLESFQQAVDRALDSDGPHFIHALNEEKGSVGALPGSPPFISYRFRKALGQEGYP